ncbi:sushi, von Willebrand factor type A, EGF and pentraxin domain-containing protein 1-like [Liolophura sinensis]|uniref:sushi, von Willebrand factor type A, EGF and pentraxin domain-containing protein 1-like n=1 Tax=Liolophura sinensis TaxID=3198878 RepID=UPI0031594F21
MSPRVLIVVVTTLLMVSVLTNAAGSYPRTVHITKRRCMTQVLRQKWIWRRVSEPCQSWRSSGAGLYSRWSRGHGDSRNWCFRRIKVLVSRVISFIHCCPGWASNFWGRCKIRVPLNDCHGGCENNGTCIAATDTCTCLPGFSGERCEQALCNPGCENGGICVVVNGTAQCKCTRSFTGPACDQAICEEGCENGGNCSAIGTTAMCWCRQGFVGKRCEHVLKEGDCPPRTIAHNCSLEAECEFDHQCAGQRKCCKRPNCGTGICTEPAPRGCRFRNEVIGLREKFRPEPCKVCTCLHPDPTEAYGGAICTNITCPRIPSGFRRCKRQTRGDNQCCKVCKEPENQRPSNITAPVFENCPEGMIVDLPKTGRTALVPRKLKAVDMQGQTLEVRYSNLSLTFNSNIDKNLHLILATAADQWEQIIECSFIVRIKDPHPPVFINCPTDVGPLPGPTASWPPPTARDNIALQAGSPDSDFTPGQAFPVGKTLVTYTAEDLEGNEEMCQFFVTILPQLATTVSSSVGDGDAMRSGQKEKSVTTDHTLFIYIGLGILALLLLLGMGLFCFLRRRRRSQETVVYTCKDEPPPPYAAVVQKPALTYYKNMAALQPTDSFDNPIYSRDDAHAYQQQNSENHVTDVVR